jgi:hypothetical protein
MRISLIGLLMLVILQLFTAGAMAFDTSALTNGVISICPWGFGDQGNAGVPGPIEITNPSAIPIMSGDADTNPSNAIVAVASTSGSGRVVALGHDGFFINGAALNLLSNRQFGCNIIDWLQGSQDSSKKKIVVTTGHGEPWVGSGQYDQFFGELAGKGYTVVKSPGSITPEMLSGASILFISCPGPSLTDPEITLITSFVSNGGGLFIQGLGWAWLAYEKTPLEEAPMNKIGASYGFKWVGGYISDPTDNHNGCPIFHVAARPDLSISSEDIEFSPDEPNAKIGDSIAIFATINNAGNTAANDVVVQFFDGNPTNGGTKIGNDRVIPSINGGEKGVAQISWVIRAENEIYVVVDPGNNIQEQNENNNIANMAAILSEFTPSENGWAFANYPIISAKPIVEWGGYCVGMSIYAQYLHLTETTPDSFTSYCNPDGVECVAGPSLPLYCPNLAKIAELQFSQFGWRVDFSKINSDTMNLDYQLIRSCLIQNIPVVLGIGPNDLHVVVAYRIIEYQDKKLIKVYDPNRPGQEESTLYLYPQSTNLAGCSLTGTTPSWTKYYCIHPDRSTASTTPDSMASTTADLKEKMIDRIEAVFTESLLVSIFSSANIKIIDPDGMVISKDSQEIPYASYIEGYSDNDHDYGQVIISNRKVGNYQIIVIPKLDAKPTDTYTLEVYSNGQMLSLAVNTPIDKISGKPYVFTVTDEGITQPPLQALDCIGNYIQDLPSSAFDKPRIADERKKVFSKKLSAIKKHVKQRNNRAAINQLTNDIRAKADGSVGGDPKNDWIADSTAQKDICKMIDDLIIFLKSNNPPNKPSKPSGPDSGKPETSYSYSTSATDPDGNPIKYTFSWGDGSSPSQTEQVDSGMSAIAAHKWSKPGIYMVKAKATDSTGLSSKWSNSQYIKIFVWKPHPRS